LDATAKRMDAHGATKDPAGVSANIKLLGTWEQAERRARLATDNVRTAVEHDGDPTATASRDALATMYWTYLDQPDALASTISHLRGGTPVSTRALGLGGAAGLVAATRAYGEHRPGRR
jgi:hypothetical protein